MIFIKYDTCPEWYECKDKKLYTVTGTFYSDELEEPHKKYAKYIECEDWHDLYLKTGYAPQLMYDIKAPQEVKDWWVRDDGFDVIGDAHTIALCLNGIDTPVADEWLEAMGWVKIKNDSVWCREQKKLGKYKKVTPQQYDRIETICCALDMYPENVLDWEGSYA